MLRTTVTVATAKTSDNDGGREGRGLTGSPSWAAAWSMRVCLRWFEEKVEWSRASVET
jgi:hypothetical protein